MYYLQPDFMVGHICQNVLRVILYTFLRHSRNVSVSSSVAATNFSEWVQMIV